MNLKFRDTRIIQKIRRRVNSLFRSNPDKILRKIKGVIHVGANTGQESSLYARYNLKVIWIEPIPEIFAKLTSNVAFFSNQIAIEGLVTDQENKEYQFHLANNNGASSSILDLNLHQDIWPSVVFEKTITLLSSTLPSLLKKNHLKVYEYNMLVIDTQGSELLVLKGAEPILHHFKFIQTEVPDFEAYKDCCQLSDVQLFLEKKGFKEFSRNKFATHPGGGNYYDIVFKQNL